MIPRRNRAERYAAVLAATLIVASFSSRLHAQGAETPEERGFAIAARADRSDRGFGDSVAGLEMVLRNKAGKEARRKLSIRTLEVQDESLGDLSLVIFDSPPDIEGTALLSHSKILEPDDQWLYLPALRRVKRISSVNKSGPFVGSEFAFEDLTSLELGKYDHKYLGEEPCGDLICDVVERIPRYENSGYSRLKGWFDQEIHQLRRVEYFDRRGDPLKTLTLSNYRQYQDQYWRAHKLEMVNQVNGKSTELIYSEYTFGQGLTEADFSTGALQRLR